MDQRSKHKSEKYEALRRKYKCISDIKSIDDERKHRLIGCHQN